MKGFIIRLGQFGALLSVLIVFLYSCARPANPTGGPTDEIPPAINEEESTKNFQTNFTDKEIVLVFDEYVELKNASQQIVVSPPSTNFLKYTVRGKKIIVEFPEDEELREDATYQINFGSAIKDYTAGNSLDNFTFVFSTGDIIDSLTLSGYVNDAATAEPVPEVLVMLYDNLSDSAFITQKPFYFSSTDDAGKFEIKNIKEDTFQLFALKDANLSLTYDQASESIAFLDTTIYLPDTNLSNIILELFDEREIPSVLKHDQKRKNYGVISFSDELRQMTLNPLDELTSFEYLITKDSCQYWYTTTLDSFQLEMNCEGNLDTFEIKKITKKKAQPKVKWIDPPVQASYFPGDSIILSFNVPIDSIDRTALSQIDSLNQFNIDEVRIKDKQAILKGKIIDTGIYELILHPNFITDLYGNQIDSTTIKFKGKSKESLGTMKVSVQNKFDEGKYICELIGKGDEVIRSRTLEQDTSLIFNRVPGGQYRLKITWDKNGNGYWDSGSLALKTKAEKIRIFTLEELRDGWDLETSIDLKNQF